MSKLLVRTAAAFVAAVLFALPCAAAPSVSARSAIVMDADTGEVVYEREADRRSLIASTTKIMTAVVVLEHCAPKKIVTVPPEATGVEGSSIYLREGEQISVRELLYGMLLHSGNDAAVALALACSGSVAEFAALMNLKAQQLRMMNTHFENPNGLDGESHYSTARDLAILTKYALKNETFAEIVRTRSIRIGERCLTNHNRLLWTLEGALGVKTGYTRAAGRILVSAAERNGRRLIAVTINDGNDWNDHHALYDYGFSEFQSRCLISNGAVVASLPLLDGTTAQLRAAEPFFYAARESERVQVLVLSPKLEFSAGREGTPAGWGAVYLGTRQIGTVRLLWGGLEVKDGRTITKDSFGARLAVAPSCRAVDCGRTGVRQWHACCSGDARRSRAR